MASRQDFTEDEWATLQRGVTGSGMLVSISDRDFTDTFGEAGAMGKFLSGQHTAAGSPLIREIAKAKGSGFGLTASPDAVRDQTLAALQSSIALLTAKAPDDVEPYRELVRGLMRTVAEAKSGTSAVEAQAEALVEGALAG